MKNIFIVTIFIILNAFRIIIGSCKSSSSTDNSGKVKQFIDPKSSYWTGQCNNDNILQSPISLIPPFTYLPINISFDFNPYSGGLITNDNGYNLIMQGDFGSFIYDDVVFTTYQINFKSPSEHALGDESTKLPLEMQILSMDTTGLEANIAILFSEADTDGQFLSNFGFGDGVMQHIIVNQSYEVPRAIDLNDIMPPQKNFFIYQGTMTTPPCMPALWLIAFDTHKVSPKQLNDFPKMLLYKDRVIQTQTREIYVTFDPALANATGSNSTQGLNSLMNALPQPTQSIYVDTFTIVGDNIPYDIQIYPSYNQAPSPRVIGNQDYLIITNYQKSVGNYTALDEDVLKQALSKLTNNTNSTNTTNANNNKSSKNQKHNNQDTSTKPTRKLTSDDDASSGMHNNFSRNHTKKLINQQYPLISNNENGDFLTDKNINDEKQYNNNSNKPFAFPSFIDISPYRMTNTPTLNLYSILQNHENLPQRNGSSYNLISGLRQRTDFSTSNNEDNNDENTKAILVEKIYQILQSDISTNKIDKNYILANLDIILHEYQNILDQNQKGNIFLQQQFTKINENIPNNSQDKSYEIEKNKDFSSFEKDRDLDKNSIQYLNKNSHIPKAILKNQILKKSSPSSSSLNITLKATTIIENPNLNEYKSTQDFGSSQIGDRFTSPQKILLQVNETESEEEEENINDMINHLSSTSNTSGKASSTVLGPLITNQVRSMFNIEEGRGSLAFNKDGVWDGVNIWQTLAWPETCKNGNSQSPVHIITNDKFKIEPLGLTFNYEIPNNDVMLANDGYKVTNQKQFYERYEIQLVVTGDFGYVLYGNHVFFVDEIDIHHPSEHAFGENSERADFEIQILHSDSFGLKIIISIFLKNINNGQKNNFLMSLGFKTQQQINPGDKIKLSDSKINLNILIQDAYEYVEYEGSLTSPPCTEGVKWFLINQRLPTSSNQIQNFQRIFGKESNVRGLQPLNGRIFSAFSSI